jgi:hypothetical protein
MSVLHQSDLDSNVWQKIKNYLEQRLQALREANDDATADETEKLRGQIKEVRSMLAWENEASREVKLDEDVNYRI